MLPYRVLFTDPGFLWLGEDHKEALANLTYGLREGNGFVVLTGEVGTGKTTLVKALLASLEWGARLIDKCSSNSSIWNDAGNRVPVCGPSDDS